MIPTSIDGTDITGATIDGQDVQEITVDGQTVFSAAFFEGFEDGNINEYSGSTGSFSVQSADVFEGNFALEVTTRFDIIHRQDAMADGDTAEFFMKINGNLLFGYDGSDGYLANFNPSSQLQMFRIDNNNFTSIGNNSSLSLPTNSYFKAVVEYNSPNLVMEAFDLSNNSLGKLSVTDSTYTNTGFGWRGDTGAIFDSLTIS